ncbi:hypothetical protein [Staphylococcus epidermidis]|uniref:hypothetical protein n=1 Tax=Staphylococcus epidermidis TaxID=1282 RepID=UPI001E5549E1|nr:hypothetical protein [Staphylococcus epidermidis]MDU2137783.1 hypothetical protein [Staphylococcus warneri]
MFSKGEVTITHQLINLEEHTNFESIQAMDNTVRQYNAKISKTHFETLNLLKQYSCKVIGVSHIKIKTMASVNKPVILHPSNLLGTIKGTKKVHTYKK